MATKQHRENSAKGGRIGGPKSPTNFKNNTGLASAAGKLSKRGPVKMKCDWCGEEINKRDFETHAEAEHPNLYRKFISKEAHDATV